MKNTKIINLILCVLTLTFFLNISNAKDIENITLSDETHIEIDKLLKSTMSEKNIPGLAIAILHNQQTIYSNYFGYANLEQESKINKNSIFQLASLTKPFTATAIMQLVEKGKINLDSSITHYIKSLPESFNKITVFNLLSHTSGLAEQINLVHDNSPVMDISTKKQLEIILQEELMFDEGTKASYSDPGYFLLGMIIESASGLTYGEYLNQEIFKPLVMTNSMVDNKWEIIKNRVSPYKYINNKNINGRRDYQHELPSHFGIISSLQDIINWDNGLRNNKLLNNSTFNTMTTIAKLNDGSDVGFWGTNYALGWMIGKNNQSKYAEHGGFTGTHLLHFLDKELSIIVLTNLDLHSGSNPRSIAHDVADIVLSKKN